MYGARQVALFAKILKNECDEDFRYIQMHVRDTLLSLVVVMLKDKHPKKSETEFSHMLDKIQHGSISESARENVINIRSLGSIQQMSLCVFQTLLRGHLEERAEFLYYPY